MNRQLNKLINVGRINEWITARIMNKINAIFMNELLNYLIIVRSNKWTNELSIMK